MGEAKSTRIVIFWSIDVAEFVISAENIPALVHFIVAFLFFFFFVRVSKGLFSVVYVGVIEIKPTCMEGRRVSGRTTDF